VMSDLVFGIGNEVIGVTTVVFLCIITLYYVFIHKREGSPPSIAVQDEMKLMIRNKANLERGRGRDNSNTDNPDNKSDNKDENNNNNNNNMNINMDLNSSIDCPICLCPFSHACTASCGHSYCGKCILSYWSSLGEDKPAICAVCRGSISHISPSFVIRSVIDEREKNNNNNNNDDKNNIAHGESGTEIDRKLESYNLKFENTSRWVHQNLLNAVGLYYNFNNLSFIPKLTVIVMVILSLLYLLLPFDVLPESVFGVLGFLDDLFVLLLTIMLLGLYYRHILIRVRLLQRRAVNN